MQNLWCSYKEHCQKLWKLRVGCGTLYVVCPHIYSKNKRRTGSTLLLQVLGDRDWPLNVSLYLYEGSNNMTRTSMSLHSKKIRIWGIKNGDFMVLISQESSIFGKQAWSSWMVYLEFTIVPMEWLKTCVLQSIFNLFKERLKSMSPVAFVHQWLVR